MTIRAIVLAAPLVLAGWVGVLAGVTLASNRAPAVLVPFPTVAFLAKLPPGTAILERNSFSVTLAHSEPGLAKMLYSAGARLVLPAGLQGCAPAESA